MSIAQKLRSVLLRISGYLIPLVQQIPPLGVYTGLMTLPVISYLVLLFSNFPASIIEALQSFFLMSLFSLGTIVSIFGFLIALYSTIYLRMHKKDRLVTTGPYRYVRHPQYTGLLLMTIGLTGWSYWILTHTFGVGWLTPEGTIGLWYAELGAYVVLALVEESYLSKEFGNGYATYKSNVPFFIPFGKASRYDIPLSILTLSLILFGVLVLGSINLLQFY